MVQCDCGELLPKDKNVLRRHEAKVHEYNVPQYKSHTPKHLSDKDLEEIVVRTEAKFKHALFSPENPINLRCRRTGHGQQ